METWFSNLRGVLAEHAQLGFWLAGLSVLALLATLLALPHFVAALPADYFVSNSETRDVKKYLGMRDLVIIAIKNVVGTVLIVAGIAMLVLPGQGLLTLFAGLVLCDYPGKHVLTLKLVKVPAVLQTLNRMRRAKNKPEFWLQP
ncbi:MAG: PGPGW domain-containing protein [Pseudomonadales bacterium]